MTYDRRLIEDSLPLEVISEQSAREKSIRHGHISTLHIWWARRPLAAMRAAIFASLIPAPKDEKEREYLHKLIADIVNWDSVKDGNNARVQEARNLIRKYYPDAPPKVLDPFMGGGSTGLEALRLGCEAHGVELNPVAYLIELGALVYPQRYGQPINLSEYEAKRRLTAQGSTPTANQKSLELDAEGFVNELAEDIRYWGKWVLESTRKEVGHLYEGLNGETILGYSWARTVQCPNLACRAQMPMVSHWRLAQTDNRSVAIRPIINRNTKRITFDIVEDNQIDFDASDGTMKRGTIRCPVCGQAPSRDYLRIQGNSGNISETMMAVIVARPNGSGKDYRPATDQDRKLYAEAKSLLEAKLVNNPDALPYEQIPVMSGTFNAPIYGIDEWGKLFNARQALTLIVLTEKIREANGLISRQIGDEQYATAITTYLALLLDRFADRNSSICTWDYLSEGPVNTFKLQALPMIWDYVEIAFGTGGPGDWTLGNEWVASLTDIAAKVSDKSAFLHCGTATRLPYSDNSFEAVVTDPPYYNAVPYADLSDFFYVWLKRSIGDIYPNLFSTPLTPKTAEITEMSSWNADIYGYKDKDFYEDQMTRAFAEAHRVLSPNGMFVVVFAHKSTAAWETLINSLLQVGFIVTASWPLHTERPGRQRARGSAALASSIFIVCRKRTSQADGFYDDVRRELQERIAERLSFFWSQGIRGADFFISAIGPAVEVFGRYSAVRKLSGDLVSVADLLDLVQEAVADYALGQIMNGRYKMGTVDAPTRFYVMYRWSYGGEKLIFDDARRLAQALGAEVNDLIHRYRLLSQSGDSVTLPDAARRKNVEHLGESGRDGIAAPVIDVLHRAVLVWQNGDRRALAEFLATHALGREDEVNSVAQALVNVLPQGDKERQLLENYLQGSGDLPDVPRQQKLI
jgi:putative DNA methylase